MNSFGKQLILSFDEVEQLQRVINRSEHCSVQILPIDLYLPPTGEEQSVTVHQVLNKFCSQMRAMSYMGSVGSNSSQLEMSNDDTSVTNLIRTIEGWFQRPSFSLVLDDPSGTSSVSLLDGESDNLVQEKYYERTDEMKEELATTQEIQADQSDDSSETSDQQKRNFLKKLAILTDDPDLYELQDRVLLGKSSAQIVSNSFRIFNDMPCIGVRKREGEVLANEYSWLSYYAVGQIVKQFANGLRSLQTGKFIAILGTNSVEWFVSDMACLMGGFTSVPLHTTFSNEQLSTIVNSTELQAIIAIGESMLEKSIEIADICSSVTTIVSTVPSTDGRVVQYQNLLDIGKVDVSNFAITERSDEDMVTIVYTSGSTGNPKGSVYTEKLWYELLLESKRQDSRSIIPLVQVSYTPLSHLTDRKLYIQGLCKGAQTGLYSGSIENLFDDIKLIRPTIFLGPPRLWSYIQSQYQLTVRQRMEERKSEEHAKQSLIEWEVRQQFSSLLGGRTKYIVTGGAYTAQSTKDFVRELFNCEVFDGYGTSETGGISSNGILDENVDFKLVDVPEMGYTLQDKPFPRGEILIKSDKMIQGYFKDEKSTSASFTEDGYFRTGDIGELFGPRKIRIIDRKSYVFKLQQGEFISPSRLEGFFIQSELISQIFIHGDMDQSYLVAVIVPNQQLVSDIADLKSRILSEISIIAKRYKLPSYEVPRDILIETEPFTPENSLLTPSLKLSRPNLLKRYRSQLTQLYQETNEKDIENQRRLLSLVELVTNKDADQTTEFTQMGGDSISAIRLIQMVQKNFNVEISKDDIFKGSFVQNIMDRLKYNNSNNRSVTNFDQDIHLDTDITPQNTESTASIASVFLTGATGFLGSMLLAKILSIYPEITVYCLIREGSSWVSFGNKWKGEPRVVPIQGTLSEPRLGLSAKDFQDLADRVDLIIHNGAVVNSYLPYEAMRAANVDGTKEIIRLAGSGLQLKHIHYVSTMSIFPSESTIVEVVDFKDKQYHPTNLHAGYSQSKNVAEQVLFIAGHERSFPVSVYRPGMISASSKDGYSNIRDWVSRLLYTIIHTGLIPKEHGPLPGDSKGLLELCPVDFVAEFIVRTALTSLHQKQHFNVMSPTIGIPWKDLTLAIQEFLVQQNKNAVIVPTYSEWIDQTTSALKQVDDTIRNDRTIWPIIDMFSSGIATISLSDQSKYPIQNTVNQMTNLSLDCPIVTAGILRQSLLYLQNH